jgi:hypothetical protein
MDLHDHDVGPERESRVPRCMLNHRQRAGAVHHRTGIERVAEEVIVAHRERDIILKIKNITLNKRVILNNCRTGEMKIGWRAGEAVNKQQRGKITVAASRHAGSVSQMGESNALE